MAQTRVENIYVEDEPAIKAAIQAIQDGIDKWMLVVPTPENRQVYKLADRGKGDFAELIDALRKIDLGFALWGTNRSSRTEAQVKLVFISLASDDLPLIRRASIAQHISSIKKLFGYSHLHVQANSIDDLDENEILVKLGTCGGAFYDHTKDTLTEGAHQMTAPQSRSSPSAAKATPTAAPSSQALPPPPPPPPAQPVAQPEPVPEPEQEAEPEPVPEPTPAPEPAPAEKEGEKKEEEKEPEPELNDGSDSEEPPLSDGSSAPDAVEDDAE